MVPGGVAHRFTSLSLCGGLDTGAGRLRAKPLGPAPQITRPRCREGLHASHKCPHAQGTRHKTAPRQIETGEERKSLSRCLLNEGPHIFTLPWTLQRFHLVPEPQKFQGAEPLSGVPTRTAFGGLFRALQRCVPLTQQLHFIIRDVHKAVCARMFPLRYL